MVITVAIFIISLFFLVMVHELGHFLTAKRFGIKVLEFGIGIPPKAWGKMVKGTLISINWLPFGGFVRLLGEDEVNKKILEDKRSFAAQKVWKRIIVVVAGIAMNLVIAWILFYIVLAAQNFRVIYPSPDLTIQIIEVEKGLPAEAAGITAGEKLVAINGQNVDSIEAAKQIIQSSAGKPLNLTLSDLNGNNRQNVTVTPKNESGQVLIGVVFSPVAVKEYKTTAQKVFSGITYSWDLTKLSFIGLGKLFSDLAHGNVGQASKSVSGPVGLAKVTNDILSPGLAATVPYLWFMGVISLTLAIMNFLPIPALDGGRLLFLYIEAITRKRVNPDLERIVHTAGFLVLIGLMVLVTFNDIHNFF